MTTVEYNRLIMEYAFEFLSKSDYSEACPIPMSELEQYFKINLRFLKKLYDIGSQYKNDKDGFNPSDEFFALYGDEIISIPESLLDDYIDEYFQKEGLEDDFIEYCKDHGYYDEDDEDDEE